MNIDDLTVKQAKELARIFGNATTGPDVGPWQLGEPYLIRTVTHYLIGRLVLVTAQELVLENAAWVADTGRFSEALNSGNLCEVEPYPDGVPAIVGRGSLIDAGRWLHDIPRKVIG
jgi:hypothetical protein